MFLIFFKLDDVKISSLMYKIISELKRRIKMTTNNVTNSFKIMNEILYIDCITLPTAININYGANITAMN